MVLAEFAMFPTDKGASVSEYVSKVVDAIDKSGISYQLTPMGTLLEGNWDEVINVITKCYNVLEEHSDRIYSVVKFDYRKGEQPRMKQKVDSVKSKIGRDIHASD